MAVIVTSMPDSQSLEESIATILAAMPEEAPRQLRDLSVVLGPSPPQWGCIDLSISVDASAKVDWSLSNYSDPFAADVDLASPTRWTFISWLEDIARGDDTVMAVEMEGPVGVLAAANCKDRDFVRLFVGANYHHALLYGAVSRRLLLEVFYRPIVAYWEQSVLPNWSAWAFHDEDSVVAKWDLKSPIIEARLAS